LEYFEVVELAPGARHTFERVGRKEKLVVGQGVCRLRFGRRVVTAERGANLSLDTPDGRFEVLEALSDTILIRMCGRWGEETGGSGLFTAEASSGSPNAGDPVDYPKETGFDSHYHDCDEYWIIFRGRGIAVSEGQSYEVGPGDCVATGMGHHHDLPRVLEPIEAVYFETTLEGQKRHGHLWSHTHGPAEPRAERV
jgi:mannose-6-phosphate isomerase-like protein (cupin superfamily)